MTPHMTPKAPPRYGLRVILAIVGGLIVLIIIGAALGGSPGNAPAASGTPAAAATNAQARVKHKHHRQTVTYVVTGSPASVTYGPAGSSLNGQVPMSITRTLRNPQFYSIDAQLNGGGAVTCRLLVNGKVISRASATGAYNIASCEISQDPLSGQWSDTNSGA